MCSLRIELVTDSDCPNVEATRSVLRDALDALGLPLEWTEWDRAAGDCPPYAQRYGSPSVLIEGKDITGEEGGVGGNACRIYQDEAIGFVGVPNRRSMIRALIRASERIGIDLRRARQ